MINQILNIKYPVFQGAMAHIATPEFAAAVSNAGGLGIIATGGMHADEARTAILKAQQLTDRPFGVNLMLMNPETPELVKVITELKPAVVTTGAGNPGPYIKQLKEAGIRIFPVVASVALAKRLARSGVDGIIAEGTESGGHVGETTTMALLPQVVKAVDIPVIAAGGIAGGDSFLAALAMGAAGVQVGTCLLVSEECPVHPAYKEAVLKAKDTSTTVTGRSLGSPVRILKNSMSREYLRLEQEGADQMEMEKLTLGSLGKAVRDGDVRDGSVMMGQAAGELQEIRPLAQILEDMIAGARSSCSRLNEQMSLLINDEAAGQETVKSEIGDNSAGDTIKE